MKTRILVALIGLPLLLFIVLFLPPVGTAVLVAAMCVLAAYELLYGAGFCRHPRILVYACLMAVGVCAWSWLDFSRTIAMAAVLVFLCLLFGEMLAAHAKLGFQAVCAAIFAGLIIPWLLGALIRVRVMENGKFFILAIFLLTMVPDSGAYFAGKAFGKHKMCPVISPNKTVEGAVGGVICTVIFMVIYALILQFAFAFRIHYLFIAIYAVLGAGASILGDKDYGTLLPGHGGILDRFDSTSVVAPLVEVLLLILPFAVK